MANANSVFLVFSLVCLSLFLYGFFLSFTSISRKNDCRMTFMFEHPNYVVSAKQLELAVEL